MKSTNERKRAQMQVRERAQKSAKGQKRAQKSVKLASNQRETKGGGKLRGGENIP